MKITDMEKTGQLFTNISICDMEEISSERLKRMNMIKDIKDRENFIKAELITMDILKKEYGVLNPVIKGSAGEKPELEEQCGIFFSRSYSDDSIVIVTDTKGIVGADVETLMKADMQVSEYFFTDEEKIFMEESDDKDFAFTLIWTRKESYIKCTGEGLSCSFNLINTIPPGIKVRKESEKLFEEDYRVKDFFMNSYYIKNRILSVTKESSDKFPDHVEKR